jgi:protein involved in polysaccharide export with SLBB domain
MRIYYIIIFFILLPAIIQNAHADLGVLDPLAKPGTRLGPGYLISLDVSLNGQDEAELCGQFALDNQGNLQLSIGGQPISKIPLRGLTVQTASELIKEKIKPYYAVEPVVRVGIARIVRITVLIQGATFRNGPVILPDGSHLSDALAEAGYQPGADLKHISIIRLEANGMQSTLNVDFSQSLESGSETKWSDPELRNADKIYIPLNPAPREEQTIMVLGEVKNPGSYPYHKGMRVLDALLDAHDLLPDADPEHVTIRRGSGNGFMVVSATKAKKNIPTDNLALEPDDTIFAEIKDTGKRFAVVGAVPTPSTFDYSHPVTLKQAILDCGGLKPDADRQHMVLIRGMLTDPAHAQTIPVNYDRLAADGAANVTLNAGDILQIPAKKKSGVPLLDIGMFLLRMFVF